MRPQSLIALFFVVAVTEAFFLGCGCRQCGCAQYGGYNSYASYPTYAPSYPSNYASSYFSPYPPGQISGYILRPVGPATSGGYALPGGAGLPVTHRAHGPLGYMQATSGISPQGPFYWQPSAGAPYERVSVGGYLL
ncbi:hypothetical protein Q1695_001776 [Nippostrongylus brasiliensis]|nr:hypothetical protein Q1695_001776 [Nippostrongylus brasiliensis]